MNLLRFAPESTLMCLKIFKMGIFNATSHL
jgi:hypothetical protein